MMTRSEIRGTVDALNESPGIRLAGRISIAIAGPLLIAGILLVLQLANNQTQIKLELSHLNTQVATIVANQYTSKDALADEKAHLEVNKAVDRRLTLIEEHIRRELEMERQRNLPSYNLRP